MRVLLIDPPYAWRSGEAEPAHMAPLGLTSLAAALRNAGHDVAVHVAGWDPWDGTDTARALDAALDLAQPDAVGLGCTTATWGAARRAAAHVRQARPDVPIAVGGPHATALPDAVLEEPAVDVAVLGEADDRVVPIFEALGADDSAALAALPGLARRDGAEIVLTARASLPTAETLPGPDHDTILWAEGAHASAFSGVLTARGCPFRCTYCAARFLGCGRLRRRSAAAVAAEVQRLVERRAVRHVFFQDSVFTLDDRHVAQVMDAIRETSGPIGYSCQTRTDCVDAGTAALLTETGCQQVMLGIESGVPETLRRIHKDPDLTAVRAAVDTLLAAGLGTSAFFMVGFPWEGAEEIRQSIDFALSLGLQAVHLFSATPLPGSELGRELGVRALPEGHDFRAPSLNFTAMPDADYRAAFEDAAERVREHNLARVLAQVSSAAAPPTVHAREE